MPTADVGCQAGAPSLEHGVASASQKRTLHVINGKVQAARAELSKLIDRHAKLSACVEAEVAQLRAMLQAREAVGGGGMISPSALLSSAAGTIPTLAAPLPLSQLASALDDEPDVPSAMASSAAAASEGEFRARPIGFLRTPFVEKNGTPRQGCVCPSSVATLRLEIGGGKGSGLNGSHSLECLSSFSHAWILFVFHLNGNQATKSKVQPPRLDGQKVGLFATRTPHRPNPIGLSLVKIDGVEGDTIHFSGVDLVDGTPVLDVKPYVPFADGHQLAGPRVAPWLATMPTPDLKVEFTPEADAQLEALAPSLRLLKTAERARAALIEILQADPRSVHWRQNRADLEYGFSLDTLNAVVRFLDGGVARVTQVQHVALCDRSHLGGGGGPPS